MHLMTKAPGLPARDPGPRSLQYLPQAMATTTLYHAAQARQLPGLARRFGPTEAALLGHLHWCVHTPDAQLLVLEAAPHAALATLLHHPTGTQVLRWLGSGPAAVPALGPALLAALPTLQPAPAPLLLQATPAEALEWEQLGLAEQAALETWTPDVDATFTEGSDPAVDLLEPTHTMALLRLDERATGEQRRTLLLEHTYAARAYLSGTQLRGALLPLLGHGLILADLPHAGLELQRWLLPVQRRLVVPEGNASAAEQLTAWGCCVVNTSVRLVHGTPPPFRPEHIFAWPWP